MNEQTYVLEQSNPDRATILANAQAFLGRLPVDKPWELIVRPFVKRQTRKQQKSLFGVAYKTIMEQAGYQGDKEKRELHRNFCGEFFGWKQDPLRGTVPIRTTTTNYTGERDPITTTVSLEMYGFIQRLCAGCGIDVPEPDPMWHEKARLERIGKAA